MKVKAVFFDAGETLLSPHPSFNELFALVLEEFGFVVAPPKVDEAFKKVAPSFVEVLDKLGTKTWSISREVSEKFWGSVYQTAFQHLAISDKDGKMAAALYERFTRYESYRLFPDALPTLRAIKNAGLTVGLISNFEEWLEGMLIEMEIAHLFDVMVISGREGIEKPDPEIFRLALERSGHSADESVYVGDNPRLDAQTATSIGMMGVLIDRNDRYREHKGPRIGSLEEILGVIGIGKESSKKMQPSKGNL